MRSILNFVTVFHSFLRVTDIPLLLCASKSIPQGTQKVPNTFLFFSPSPSTQTQNPTIIKNFNNSYLFLKCCTWVFSPIFPFLHWAKKELGFDFLALQYNII